MSPETSNYGQFLFDSQERVILEPVAEGQFSKGHNMSYNHDIQILWIAYETLYYKFYVFWKSSTITTTNLPRLSGFHEFYLNFMQFSVKMSLFF